MYGWHSDGRDTPEVSTAGRFDMDVLALAERCGRRKALPHRCDRYGRRRSWSLSGCQGGRAVGSGLLAYNQADFGDPAALNESLLELAAWSLATRSTYLTGSLCDACRRWRRAATNTLSRRSSDVGRSAADRTGVAAGDLRTEFGWLLFCIPAMRRRPRGCSGGPKRYRDQGDLAYESRPAQGRDAQPRIQAQRTELAHQILRTAALARDPAAWR
jgi:hypothetical protein